MQSISNYSEDNNKFKLLKMYLNSLKTIRQKKTILIRADFQTNAYSYNLY